MIKRSLVLVIISSMVSAGLLFLGTTVMGKFYPVLASSQNALVAGTNVLISSVSNLAEENVSHQIGQFSENKQTDPAIISTAEPISNPTIKELLSNPVQYNHKTFTIIGKTTFLNSEKFLLNDGTGQILVELEDHLVGVADLKDQTMTVTGKFDDSSGQYGYKLDAYTLTDNNDKIVYHDCINDDCPDDLTDNNGTIDIDCQDDNCPDDIDCQDDNCPDDIDCRDDNCPDDVDCRDDNCPDDLKNDDCLNDDCSDDIEDESKDKSEGKSQDGIENSNEGEDD